MGAGAEYVLHGIIFVILARLLSPDDFGIYALATVVIGLSRVFSEIGLGPSLVQRRDLEDVHIRAAFTATLFLSLVSAGIIAALAPVFADLLGNADVAPVIRALSLLFLLRGAGLVAGFLLQRNLRLSVLARTKVLSYLIGYGFVGIVLAFSGFGYWALVAAALCEATIENTQFLFLTRHPKRLLFRWRPLQDLLSFGVGSSLGRMGNYLAMKGDYLVVGRFLGVGALGIYSRAYELMAMPVGLYQAMANKAFFSAVAIVQDDRIRLSRALARTTAVTALVLLPAGIGLCILAPELIDVVLGERWTSVVAPFQVIALGMFFRSGYAMSEAVAKGTGHVHALALRQGIYAALVVMGAWCGHFFGISGVAAGVLLAMVIHYLLATQLGLRASGLSAREFALAHVPAVTLGGVVLVSVLTPAFVLRGIDAPSWVTLIASSAFGLFIVCIIARGVPNLVGPHGAWAISYFEQLRKSRKKKRPNVDEPGETTPEVPGEAAQLHLNVSSSA